MLPVTSEAQARVITPRKQVGQRAARALIARLSGAAMGERVVDLGYRDRVWWHPVSRRYSAVPLLLCFQPGSQRLPTFFHTAL